MKSRSKNPQAAPNSVRIIAGQWRGRRIPVLSRDGLRPTTDRVRERLFNWLMHDIAGARCLDLFAGTGALGLECLSRGASFVQFVEADKRVAKTLGESLALLANGSNSEVEECNAIDFLNRQSGLYDIVFLDPPFQSDLLAQSIAAISQPGCLADGALIYIEQAAKTDLVELPKNWQVYREGQTGQSRYALALYSPNAL